MVINSSIFHKITKNSFLKIEKTREIIILENKIIINIVFTKYFYVVHFISYGGYSQYRVWEFLTNFY